MNRAWRLDRSDSDAGHGESGSSVSLLRQPASLQTAESLDQFLFPERLVKIEALRQVAAVEREEIGLSLGFNSLRDMAT